MTCVVVVPAVAAVSWLVASGEDGDGNSLARCGNESTPESSALMFGEDA